MSEARLLFCNLLIHTLVLGVAPTHVRGGEQKSGESWLQWETLPPVPDPRGVAAPFAGVTENQLLVAGGANFPERPPWKNGKKVWYDRVWALASPKASWQGVG
ncbi:MAG TPA: hypothetical protein VF175_04645, partial [Lacipirellula sp.]